MDVLIPLRITNALSPYRARFSSWKLLIKKSISGSDLDKLSQSKLVTTSPNPNKITTYEGVYLDNLLATMPQHQESGMVKVSYGFFHTKTFSAA